MTGSRRDHRSNNSDGRPGPSNSSQSSNPPDQTSPSLPQRNEIENSANPSRITQFCSRMELTSPLQNEFVDVITGVLTRISNNPTAKDFLIGLQEEFTPELFAHPDISSKKSMHKALQDKMEQLGISIPPFTEGSRRSNVMRLANIIWQEPQFAHERDVVQHIVLNRLTPNPMRPITLYNNPSNNVVTQPNVRLPIHISQSMQEYQTSSSQGQPRVQFNNQLMGQNITNGNPFTNQNINTNINMPANSLHPLLTERNLRSSNDYRVNANSSSSAPTIHQFSRASQMQNNLGTPNHFQPFASTGNYHPTQPQLRTLENNRLLPPELLHGREHPPQIVPPTYPSYSNTFDGSRPIIPHGNLGNHHRPSPDHKALFDRNIKIANAFSSAFKDVKNRYSGHIEDSWPKKKQLFEDVIRNYRIDKEEGLLYLNNLFTGDASLYFYQHIQDKVRTYDEAIVKIETKFHRETNQERIVSKLESLRFDDYKSENMSPNDAFSKLTSHLEELFPRTPFPFQSQYNKRRILARAVAGQAWATQTLYRSSAELPDYSSLSTALAAVLQKHLELNKRDNNFDLNMQETFYANPRYGRNDGNKSNRKNTNNYGSTNHHNSQANKLVKSMNDNACYRCGSCDHFIKDCPLRRDARKLLTNLRQNHNRRKVYFVLQDAMELLQIGNNEHDNDMNEAKQISYTSNAEGADSNENCTEEGIDITPPSIHPTTSCHLQQPCRTGYAR